MRNGEKGAFIALATIGIFLLWLAATATGTSLKLVEAVHAFLPTWFPVANLFLVPLLIVAAGFPRTPPLASLLLYGIALCFGSALYISYLDYPIATLIAVAAVYLEAYWLLPRWRHKSRASGSQHEISR